MRIKQTNVFKDVDIAGNKVRGEICRKKLSMFFKNRTIGSAYRAYQDDDLISIKYLMSFLKMHNKRSESFLDYFGKYDYYPIFSVLQWLGYR